MVPYFSIIIPVYRDIVRLKSCLDRFGEMSHPGFDFEVIVVNNDPDNSVLGLDLLQYSYSLKEIHEPNPGSYAARNKGIQVSLGKILGFTDSDCLPLADWLEVAFEYFSKDEKKETGVLTGPVPLFFKNPHNLTDAEVYEKYTGFTTETYAKEGQAITANWFSYKCVIEEFGGFNSLLKSNGDSELSAKISSKYKINFAVDLVVMHPSRFQSKELVEKYRRILGGTYLRKFQERKKLFAKYVLNFIWRRYRFALKKSLTIPFSESLSIIKVCTAINVGVIKEFFQLTRGEETKR